MRVKPQPFYIYSELLLSVSEELSDEPQLSDDELSDEFVWDEVSSLSTFLSLSAFM